MQNRSPTMPMTTFFWVSKGGVEKNDEFWNLLKMGAGI